MKVTDITWDTDGEDIELPTEVEVPNDIAHDEDGRIDEDEIADYLSDEYGWCVISFSLPTDDEMIRQALIKGFQDYYEHTSAFYQGESVEDILNWLERQKPTNQDEQ